MNKRITALMLALLMIFSAAVMSSCNGQKSKNDGLKEDIDQLDELEEYDNGESDFDNPIYDDEQDGAEVVRESHDVEDFYGKWRATSNHAAYLYGNIDINIKKDGTWKGNITDENFSGAWTYDGSQMVIKDREGVIDFTMFYNDKGIMHVVNNEEPEDPLVLEKV